MRDHLCALALKLVSIPYIWGGATPQVGFDCSGFVIWIYQVFNILPSGDWTAYGLSELFETYLANETPQKGDLVFYGPDIRHITHVMLYFGNGLVIGASGGDHACVTPEEARKKNAMVKIKPMHYRTDFQFACDIDRRIDDAT